MITQSSRLVRRATYAERLETQVAYMERSNRARYGQSGCLLAEITRSAQDIDMGYRVAYVSDYVEFTFTDGSSCSFMETPQ